MSLKSRLMRCRRYLRSILLFIYFSLLGFALFNYKSHCVYTMPDALLQMSQIGHSNEGKCKVNLDELGEVKVDIFTEPTEEEIEERNPEVGKGGVWAPKGCQAWQKVAIIIPYRDRYPFLKILLNRILPMMQRQQLSFHVFVVEQAGNKQFNRGKLMNIGYMEALKFDKFDCFVFQDADLLPETDKNLYMCDPHARHLASAINEMRYHVMYYNYAGGVIALNRENYHRINGYSNSYWGWGNEDDDFSARILESGLLLTRPPEHIGRYKMVRHKKQTRSDHGNEMFLGWRSRWSTDGLSDPVGMNYTRVDLQERRLYTHVKVNIGDPPAKMRLGNPDELVSLWWFLKFYFP
ncbi:beta-1,4-galactosyltransferase 4-like isoform X2 [Babylonia areolata]|uniref:beta-1,4-galactosyltransferase 4-like isoform X1 n=1 Tax=Babylonia areolata TaxID=304850 RepID=UPI003FD48C13